MKLSKAERLILVNQYELLKHLDQKNEKDYEEKIEIIKSGYEELYPAVASHLHEEFTTEDCQFVWDILNLYRAVHYYMKNNQGKETKITNHPWSKFNGFDLDNEAKYFGFTKFIIQNQGRYPELAKIDLNSHSPRIPKYRRMVDKFKKYKVSEIKDDQWLEIFEA
ncbi:YfbU family protein [Thiotrichales bacterium 19S9-12]|nr:YfbU family protein [Thiotrichales bacterium 19S9-11]MCF6812091.1 YfbU family protein [Thiotrichales bacterium 19S9-12]